MSSLRLAIKLSKQGGSSAASITDARRDSRISSTSTASPGKRRKATAATNVTPAPKDAAGTGCSLRLSIKRSLGEDGADSIILSATPPVRGNAGGPTTSSPTRAKLLPAVSDSSSSTVGDRGVGKKACKLAAKRKHANTAKDSLSTPKAVSPYASSISSHSLSSTDTESAVSLAGIRIKLASKATVGGAQPTLQNSLTSHKSPFPARQSPMLYLGIALERPETVHSWGLVFSKEKTSSALVVRVNTPNEGEEGPRVNWSRITQSGPNPALIYRTVSTALSPEEYETSLTEQFPPPCEDQRLQEAEILEPRLCPGDAIISVNGINVSSFPTMEAFAAFIRQNCQRKVVFVAMRHEYVWAAARGQVSQSDMGSSTNTTDRVATAVRAAWRVLASAGSSHKRKAPSSAKRPKIMYTNALFKDEQGRPIPYCDNDDRYEEGRLRNFVNDEIETSFHEWLRKRKATWRESRPTMHTACMDEVGGIEDCRTLRHDFWLANGHESFEQWLQTSKTNWSRSYTWHKERLEALQSECEKDVHLPTVAPVLHQFENWLGARKQQWRLERRKRQRQRIEISDLSIEEYLAGSVAEDCSPADPTTSATATNVYMDEILDKELDDLAATKEEETTYPMDISWVFDGGLGAPDDIIVNVMTYLRPSDHGNLLCLSYTSNFLFKQREDLWKALCPKHWILPRRPRKSWCAMYITKIRAEEEATRKRSDDLLVKANAIIEKADQLNKLEKLVRKAEKDFDFDAKYTSGVVLERNSLLNLAVIEGRHKITKWLVEEKEADIESCDRGQFTPLMNAAWNGDKYLVRYLLGRGCDRTKMGYNHSSEGLAPATFEGLTAEGWARKRGHDEVAELIKFGL